MRNLLQANLFRLRRDKTLWACLLTVLGCSAGLMITWCLENAERGALVELDVFYFRFAPMISFFYSVFGCLFLAAEYSEGTIRNKLVVGHTRCEVYLSNFLAIFAALLCMAAAWLAGGLAGAPFLGFLKMGAGEMLLCLAVIIGFTAAFSAIYTCIGMLNDRRTAVVATITVWLVLLLVAMSFEAALVEPELVSSAIIGVDGEIVEKLQKPNPYYISGFQRDIYELVMDLLPTGQSSWLQRLKLDRPVRMLLCSAFITASTTLWGISRFQRKDLK